MGNDKTVIFSGFSDPIIKTSDFIQRNEIRVSLCSDSVSSNTSFFRGSFSIGRSFESDFSINDSSVSRNHLDIRCNEHGVWFVSDLNSTNGSYINELQLHSEQLLTFPCEIYLGNSGVCVYLNDFSESAIKHDADITQIIEKKIETIEKPSVIDIRHRFLSKESVDESVGEYTQMVRNAIQEDRKVSTRWYKGIISLFILILLTSISIVVYQQNTISNAKNIAIDMFYDMKSLEIELVRTEIVLREKKDRSSETEQSMMRKRRNLFEMKKKYQSYVKELNTYKFNFINKDSYEDELILKVAQAFGECELEIPEGFSKEVNRYIKYWQNSNRMQTAMLRLKKSGHAPLVISALTNENLPIQFLYLALQESNFNSHAIGPETKYGIAKGAWQFLPETGREFGVLPGPLSTIREFDPDDERFDFEKATQAAAKYLKHIYSTEAQASALLVMAGYNYGHNRVKRMIKSMPDNPRDKNFWKFVNQYQIPKETYDYVFYIFSAAVIGEDPKYFGFKFESPTKI